MFRTGEAVYLTFDDGPIPEVTPKVLDILAQYGVKATFFMVGENIDKHPEVFAQVIAAGHALGNHTYNHLKGWNHSFEQYMANVEKALAAVPGVTGAEVSLEEKTAVIRMDAEVADQALMDAVKAKGFEPIKML